jgi:hypothetical protein
MKMLSDTTSSTSGTTVPGEAAYCGHSFYGEWIKIQVDDVATTRSRYTSVLALQG